MEVFPEASSAAQDGKPAGSYTASGVDGSKISFGVDVQSGESGYQDMLSFAEPGSSQVAGGDEASAVTFSDGRAGIIARKGDAVIRVDWDPQAGRPGRFRRPAGQRAAGKHVPVSTVRSQS